MYELTAKELEVLALVAMAKSDKEIAKSHWNSIRTIQNHVHNILVKTSCKNRRELMALYLIEREKFNVPSKNRYQQITELLAKKTLPITHRKESRNNCCLRPSCRASENQISSLNSPSPATWMRSPDGVSKIHQLFVGCSGTSTHLHPSTQTT